MAAESIILIPETQNEDYEYKYIAALGSGHAFYIPVQVNMLEIKALVDSGASRSLISTIALDKLKISKYCIQPSNMEAYGINGYKVPF
jgi:predicted aspartyl protease